MTHTCPMCGQAFRTEDDFAVDYRAVCPACGTVVREGPSPEDAAFTVDRSFASEKVSAPAICLMLLGGLALLGGLFQLALAVLVQFVDIEHTPPEERIAASAFYAVAAIYSLAVGGFIVYGGLKMKHLESWGFALTAAILAVIPCNVCCVFGMPIGLWSLITLNDLTVRAAFQSEAARV